MALIELCHLRMHVATLCVLCFLPVETSAAEISRIAGAGQQFRLWQTERMNDSGLRGSVVSENVRFPDAVTDWRTSEKVASTITTTDVAFNSTSWPAADVFQPRDGRRYFSVQWDGFLEVVKNGAQFYLRSDGGSQFWIDVDGDGEFEMNPEEHRSDVDGRGQRIAVSDFSPSLGKGTYRIRIQFRAGIGSGNVVLSAKAPYVVRVAYLIPDNRTVQKDLPSNVQWLLQQLQQWYAVQMTRHGFGAKTFRFETPPGSPPPVHVVHLPGPDSEYQHEVPDGNQSEHSRAWKDLVARATSAGVPVGAFGEIWLLIWEVQAIRADGSITGRINRGGRLKYNQHTGVGTAIATFLAMANDQGFALDVPYNGKVFPQIGPTPLKYGVSFRDPAGTTISRIISMEAGSTCHELSHAFGLSHNRRNDSNISGSMMGTSYRRFRSEFGRRRFPGESVNLSRASARVLSVNRHFDSDRDYTDDVPPRIDSVEAAPSLKNGLFEVRVRASDNEQLACATLNLQGYITDDIELKPGENDFTLRSDLFKPQEPLTWSVSVYDRQGNIRVRSGTATSNMTGNRAPIPLITADRYEIRRGESVTFNAALSRDPDGARSGLKIEWDFDGDGRFETRPDQNVSRKYSFRRPGYHQVFARLTDEDGARSVSDPVIISVTM